MSLGDMRAAAGLTLDEVCERMTEVTGKALTRGALSAIERGHRGASRQTLDALAFAYGLRAGAISTDYEPRSRAEAVTA